MSQYKTNVCLREPIIVRSTLNRFIKTLSLFLLATWISFPYFPFLKPFCYLITCQGLCRMGVEWPGVEWSYSGVEGSWQQKWGTTLASAHMCKGTPHTWLQSIPYCLPTQFHCAAPGYQRIECKDILYIVDYSLQEPHLILWGISWRWVVTYSIV